MRKWHPARLSSSESLTNWTRTLATDPGAPDSFRLPPATRGLPISTHLPLNPFLLRHSFSALLKPSPSLTDPALSLSVHRSRPTYITSPGYPPHPRHQPVCAPTRPPRSPTRPQATYLPLLAASSVHVPSATTCRLVPTHRRLARLDLPVIYPDLRRTHYELYPRAPDTPLVPTFRSKAPRRCKGVYCSSPRRAVPNYHQRGLDWGPSVPTRRRPRPAPPSTPPPAAWCSRHLTRGH